MNIIDSNIIISSEIPHNYLTNRLIIHCGYGHLISNITYSSKALDHKFKKEDTYQFITLNSALYHNEFSTVETLFLVRDIDEWFIESDITAYARGIKLNPTIQSTDELIELYFCTSFTKTLFVENYTVLRKLAQ